MTDKISVDEIKRALGMTGNPDQEKILAWLRTLDDANKKIQEEEMSYEE